MLCCPVVAMKGGTVADCVHVACFGIMKFSLKKDDEREIELIRVSEAARLLCVPTMTTYRMMRDGRLHGYKIKGCMMKVDKHDVIKMIEAGRI